MSGLRCWPGALATMHQTALPANRWRMVEVIGPMRPGQACSLGFANHGHLWWVRSLGAPVPGTNGLVDSEFNFPDAWLTPITPPPGTDCTTHDADKPQPVEAA